jgi:hypothetical protein
LCAKMVSEVVRMGNLIEGIFWIAVGLLFLLFLVRPGYRRAKIVAAINLAVFGISNFVEMGTGTWYHPWWLLVWKSACVAVACAQLLQYVRGKRAASARARRQAGARRAPSA